MEHFNTDNDRRDEMMNLDDTNEDAGIKNGADEPDSKVQRVGNWDNEEMGMGIGPME